MTCHGARFVFPWVALLGALAGCGDGPRKKPKDPAATGDTAPGSPPLTDSDSDPGDDSDGDSDLLPPSTGDTGSPPPCTPGEELAQAVAEAGAGSTIHVCGGVHAVNLVIGVDVRVVGAGEPAETVLDGGGVDSTVRVIDGASVVLRGLTLTGGAASGEPDRAGGLDGSLGGELTVISCVVEGNTGPVGGLSAAADISSHTTLRDVVLRHNAGDALAGGAALGYATLTRVEIAENTGTLTAAGGVYLIHDGQAGARVTADAATVIRDNAAELWGGGLAMGSSTSWTGGEIRGNSAELGGGIAMLTSDQVFVGDVTIVGNTAVTGGGVANLPEAGSTQPTWIVQSEIRENSAQLDGGGVYWQFVGWPILLELGEVALEDNAATGDGGAVWTDAESIVARPMSRIVGNTANRGAGVFLGPGLVTLNVTEVRGNTAIESGGGAYLKGVRTTLAGLTCDLGTKEGDNLPQDIALDGGHLVDDYGEGVTFSCDGYSGVCDP